MDIDLWRLQSFVAAVEEGSIRSGARRVRVAQPALSQGIRKLERQFGARLLDRSYRGIEMTEAGELVLEYARGVLQQTDLVADRVAQISRLEAPAAAHHGPRRPAPVGPQPNV